MTPEFEREIKAQREFRTMMRDAATIVRNQAQVFAKQAHEPWVPRKRYGLIDVVQHRGETYVVNRDHLGHIAEWGGRYQTPQAPLRRAARAVGVELRETPK